MQMLDTVLSLCSMLCSFKLQKADPDTGFTAAEPDLVLDVQVVPKLPVDGLQLAVESGQSRPDAHGAIVLQAKTKT